MAPKIWGFNLGEMRWSAFRSDNMFSNFWHLRGERFIVYQLAMLVCLAAECTATYSLSKYEKLQNHIELNSAYAGTASLYNNDIIGAAITTIVFCVFVATLFGADFFFLLFFPRRTYPRWYNAARKAAAVAITAGLTAAAIYSTYIVARHSAYISGVPDAAKASLVKEFFRPPLHYASWGVNIAWVVLLWLGWCFTVASTALLFVAVEHDEVYGPQEDPRSDHFRNSAGRY